MLFTKFLLAAAAFTLASCQTVQFTNSDYSVNVGTAFTITWSGATSNVTLLLKNGPKDSQATVLTITSGATGTSFSWVPPSTLAPGTYDFEIDAAGQTNYSPQFTISGGSGSSSSAGSSASAASATSAKASASTSAAPSSSTSTTASTAVTSSASSKSGGSTTTVASNTTVSATATVTRTSATSTSTSSTIPSANNAAQYASPFAFVLLTFAAMAALN